MECLKRSDVEEVLIINRRHAGYSHAKLKEAVLPEQVLSISKLDVPALRKLFPSHVATLEQIATGMINAVKHQPSKAVLEVSELVELSRLS